MAFLILFLFFFLQNLNVSSFRNFQMSKCAVKLRTTQRPETYIRNTQNIHKKYSTCICSLDCSWGENKPQFHCLFPSFSPYMLELIEFLLDEASEVCGRGVCSQERWRFTGGWVAGRHGGKRGAERRRYDGGKSWLRRGTQKIVSHSISLSRLTISFHPRLSLFLMLHALTTTPILQRLQFQFYAKRREKLNERMSFEKEKRYLRSLSDFNILFYSQHAEFYTATC